MHMHQQTDAAVAVVVAVPGQRVLAQLAGELQTAGVLKQAESVGKPFAILFNARTREITRIANCGTSHSPADL